MASSIKEMVLRAEQEQNGELHLLKWTTSLFVGIGELNNVDEFFFQNQYKFIWNGGIN